MIFFFLEKELAAYRHSSLSFAHSLHCLQNLRQPLTLSLLLLSTSCSLSLSNCALWATGVPGGHQGKNLLTLDPSSQNLGEPFYSTGFHLFFFQLYFDLELLCDCQSFPLSTFFLVLKYTQGEAVISEEFHNYYIRSSCLYVIIYKT